MKSLTKAFIIVFVLIFLKGITSGKHVEAHIIVKRHSLPNFFGNGPVQSIMSLPKSDHKDEIHKVSISYL